MLELNLSLQKKIIAEIEQMGLLELMRHRLRMVAVNKLELMQFKLNMETGQEIST